MSGVANQCECTDGLHGARWSGCPGFAAEKIRAGLRGETRTVYPSLQHTTAPRYLSFHHHCNSNGIFTFTYHVVIRHQYTRRARAVPALIHTLTTVSPHHLHLTSRTRFAPSLYSLRYSTGLQRCTSGSKDRRIRYSAGLPSSSQHVSCRHVLQRRPIIPLVSLLE